MRFDWEKIYSNAGSVVGATYRAKVYGGWIVKSFEVNDCNSETTSESMVFVPDPRHEWKITF
jgi:hypothetical protein